MSETDKQYPLQWYRQTRKDYWTVFLPVTLSIHQLANVFCNSQYWFELMVDFRIFIGVQPWWIWLFLDSMIRLMKAWDDGCKILVLTLSEGSQDKERTILEQPTPRHRQYQIQVFWYGTLRVLLSELAGIQFLLPFHQLLASEPVWLGGWFGCSIKLLNYCHYHSYGSITECLQEINKELPLH